MSENKLHHSDTVSGEPNPDQRSRRQFSVTWSVPSLQNPNPNCSHPL
ncbi:MAG: hypothetical protein OGMRLDGQ_001059, partial [Candidatus Fervidibacter sp.]